MEWKLAVLELLRWCVNLVWHVFKGFVRQMFTVGYFYLTHWVQALIPRWSVMPGFGNESMEIWGVHYSYSKSVLNKKVFRIHCICVCYKIHKVQKGVDIKKKVSRSPVPSDSSYSTLFLCSFHVFVCVRYISSAPWIFF